MGLLLKTAMRVTGGMIQRPFDRATRDPEAAQTALLLDILRENRQTEYGQEHGFSRIVSVDDFARFVPIAAFPDLAPYVERIKAGQANVLTSAPTARFTLTSGTTDKPKYLPITREGMACTARTSHQWMCRALHDHPAFLDHSIIGITGESVEGRTQSGVPYGSASGMMYQSLPRILHRSFALPFALSGIRNYDLRYYVTARVAYESDPSFVVTPSPATLIRIAETGVRYQEDLIRSIRDGNLFSASPFDTTAADARILDAIRARLRPNRPKARFLEQVAQQHGRLTPSTCWKNLRLIGCWLGGSIGLHVDKMAAYFGQDVPRRDIGYLASEGAITIPYQDNTSAGILALHDSYYEFIPAGESSAPGRRPLQCHEVEEGRQYKIILTNRNGLYRYDIQDIVEVRGFYNRAPVIAFVRKGAEMLNIAGEKTHANHFVEVFRRLELAHGVAVRQFRIVPNCADARYELLVEFDAEPSLEFLRSTALPLIDKSLSDVNMEYDGKRRSGRLAPPRVHVMDETWADDVRKCFMEAGHRDAQYKWRTMATEMSAVDARHIRHTISM